MTNDQSGLNGCIFTHLTHSHSRAISIWLLPLNEWNESNCLKHILIEWTFCTSFGEWNAKCVIMKCAMCDASFGVSRKIVSCFLSFCWLKWNFLLQTSYETWDIPFSFAWHIPSYEDSRFHLVRSLKRRSFHSNENYLHISYTFSFNNVVECAFRENGFFLLVLAVNVCLNCEWLIKCRCCLRIPPAPALQLAFQFMVYGVHMKLNAFVHYELQMIRNS